MGNIFKKIFAPLKSYLELQGNEIDKETGSGSLTELQGFWKIGIHWIRKMINPMAESFDYKVIVILGTT